MLSSKIKMGRRSARCYMSSNDRAMDDNLMDDKQAV